jgi:hypothetical protein
MLIARFATVIKYQIIQRYSFPLFICFEIAGNIAEWWSLRCPTQYSNAKSAQVGQRYLKKKQESRHSTPLPVICNCFKRSLESYLLLMLEILLVCSSYFTSKSSSSISFSLGLSATGSSGCAGCATWIPLEREEESLSHGNTNK